MKSIFTSVLAMAILYPIVAAQETPVDPPWIKDVVSQRVFFEVPGMAEVRVRKDVVYKRAGERKLTANIYSPTGAKPAKGRPVILFVHGGTLPPNLRTTIKDWGVYISYGQLAAASGFVGITFNTRFHDWTKISEPQSDVSDMIDYVRHNADSLGVDKDRITLWAFSAGRILLNDALREPQPYIKSVVAFYPVLDPKDVRGRIPQTVTDETLLTFSPVQTVRGTTKRLPPILIARAGLDNELNAGVDNFIQSALKKNLTIEIINHPRGQHAFDVRDNVDRTREIIGRTLDFIKLHT